MHIYAHSNVQREREREREERDFPMPKQAFPDWDRKTVSHLIEFMNYLYPSILSGLS